MVEKVDGYVSAQGKVFLCEEAAHRSETIERLCEIVPELQMIRPRLESNLDALASAMGPFLSHRRMASAVMGKARVIAVVPTNPDETTLGRFLRRQRADG